MICLASVKRSRAAFIEWFRTHCRGLNAKAHHIPEGMFAPGGMFYSNILPWFVPIVGVPPAL